MSFEKQMMFFKVSFLIAKMLISFSTFCKSNNEQRHTTE
ncbi:hypothetical protein ymoll0001_38100 [Yersinia mollaretii ATCC 43969]|uniref:Lipoprotein n=1 Tax=Yersinia mollaretii (strain ATCC 43969 / DSM 18520 / CIP 103324 / CNY 7263 / WAIP 204) TaxID=349967 RepID=A0ABP2E8P2_YERMW|nr:hypothetical protein ymoll0001_38100 [Yersinia mollaretii ATCC 43969]